MGKRRGQLRIVVLLVACFLFGDFSHSETPEESCSLIFAKIKRTVTKVDSELSRWTSGRSVPKGVVDAVNNFVSAAESELNVAFAANLGFHSNQATRSLNIMLREKLKSIQDFIKRQNLKPSDSETLLDLVTSARGMISENTVSKYYQATGVKIDLHSIPFGKYVAKGESVDTRPNQKEFAKFLSGGNQRLENDIDNIMSRQSGPPGEIDFMLDGGKRWVEVKATANLEDLSFSDVAHKEMIAKLKVQAQKYRKLGEALESGTRGQVKRPSLDFVIPSGITEEVARELLGLNNRVMPGGRLDFSAAFDRIIDIKNRVSYRVSLGRLEVVPFPTTVPQLSVAPI
jgi:hypothetical protein